MDDQTTGILIGLAVGAAAGLGAALGVARSHQRRLDDKEAALREALEARARLEGAASLAEQSRADALAAKDREVERLLAAKDEAIEEQRALLARAEERLKETFDSLSVQALKTATDQFLKTANATFERVQEEAKGDLKLKQQAIDQLLDPVRESLKSLDKRCIESDEKRAVAEQILAEQIRGLLGATDSLSNALRRPNTRGSWGEITLRTVLDNAGLVEGQDYELQHTTDAADGKLRADAVVRLPKNRQIVIDCKTPLETYREAVNAPDETTRQLLLARHAQGVRNHVKDLSSKAYWQQYEGADYVLMFLPSESMYQAALEQDPSLLMDAINNRVHLANPMTLVGVLRAVAYVLDQERLNQSALEISDIGRKLYESMRIYAEHMSRLGRNLRQTVDAYNASVGSLERNMLPKARQLKSKGASSGDAPLEPVTVDVLPSVFRSPELAVDLEEALVGEAS